MRHPATSDGNAWTAWDGTFQFRELEARSSGQESCGFPGTGLASQLTDSRTLSLGMTDRK